MSQSVDYPLILFIKWVGPLAYIQHIFRFVVSLRCVNLINACMATLRNIVKTDARIYVHLLVLKHICTCYSYKYLERLD